ncbi:MAG: cytochrome c family protein [Pelagibacteraceae bacterium]|jgi:cytochrome c|nr:cytochrome c family protein [Pelagibacteraceae bacterium]MDP6784855.1 cytochrome c family protein [Alphaproteobacteria bacterium]MBO6466871.1 cytochrome c family protein [Pelagibacteraceae bacterium]MBO6467316.1 cytochrome c family protein [Pelagibacteraceae bacterium]MBO6469108.1 cytochrome c family protein [Pelagibacteraceae bacterium]|tara:strand:+ start:264 stop:812 length:549 start_codon:yes stop_codon:yes gene_type:complete
MSGFEINKILASILVAIIIFVIIGFVGNFIAKINYNESLVKAYKIDLPETSTDSTMQKTTDNEMDESISSLLASASLAKGEKIFNKCGACHNYKKGSKSKIGPNLWDLINRQKASVSGFAYSKALSEYGGKWTFEELDEFLYKPKEYISGTKMIFLGLNNVRDRANLMLWLRQQSDNPIPLP